jgi:multimeric flavodoxin WrbA
MQEIYSSYREAEMIVWTSPMYWGYLTAQLKIVQDRMEALTWEGFEGKTFIVLITYKHHYQSATGMFERIAPYFKIKLYTLTCRTYNDETREDISISACVNELREAYELGIALGTPMHAR